MTEHLPLEEGPPPGRLLDVPIVINVPVWTCLYCGAKGEGRGWDTYHRATCRDPWSAR